MKINNFSGMLLGLANMHGLLSKDVEIKEINLIESLNIVKIETVSQNYEISTTIRATLKEEN